MNQQPLIPHGAPISGSLPLPVHPPEHLWDREAVVAALHRDLKVGTAVLLYGPAGIGKTALAATLAAAYTASGVLWIEAADDSIQSLLNRVARAYGIDPASFDTDSLAEQLQIIRDLLHLHHPFIVLDGRIHIDAAREFVRNCAAGIPLVLTQTKLAAGPWTPHEVGPLSISATIEMLGSGGTPEVAQLAEILAGHPLAIVVARHHLGIRGINPPDFWAQITPGPAGEANRAAGVLMAAYRLLPSALQGLLLLIGASFTESISEELLSDVAGAPVTALRPAVAQLVTRGLVSERESGCYVIHELVQAFAQAFLRGKKQLEAMQSRHLRAVLAYVRRHADQHEPLAAEIETILAAGIYAAQNNQPDTLREMIGILGSFASQRGFSQEIRWLEHLLEQPDLASGGLLSQPETAPSQPPIEAIPQPEAARPQPDVIETLAPAKEESILQELLSDAELEGLDLELEEPAAEVVRPMPPEAEAPALFARGQEAEATQSQALDSYQANGSIDDELAALQALAKLNLQQENVAGVLDYIDKGMTLAQQSDNPRREGELLIVLGDLQMMLGRYQGAEDAYREAINALRPVDAWDDIADTLKKLGDVYLVQNRPLDAASVWEQTIPIFERSKSQPESVDILSRLSDLYADQLQWREALANRTRALEQARNLGDGALIYEQLSNLGTLLEDSGDRAGAIPYYQQALTFAFQMNDSDKLGHTLLAVGRTQIDDSVQLNRVVQLLDAAQHYLPDDTDVQRLLKRAKTRQERLVNAGFTMMPPEESLEDYAARLADSSGG